jgi:hypothetical protein
MNRLVSLVPAAACVALALAAAPAPEQDFERRIDRMLSAAWLADLYPLTRDPDITDEGYQAALASAIRCARLAPDRRAAWDLALLLADQVEIGAPDAARAARKEALEALSKLDPADDVVRLARISDAIDAHPTADARVRAYESILAERNRAAIGAPVAARLAYQLASLQSRIGNPELFARWLADSVKTDPGFPAAAQAAAGFFRMRVNDPAADVELLSVAVEANPRDIQTWGALLGVLLDGGAFRGAERVARLAIAVADGERRNESVYAFTGDLATALWGSGQRDAAIRELDLRMGRLTSDFRRFLSMLDPSITNERLEREFPPLPSTLSIAMLGLAKRQGDQARSDQLLERALRGVDTEIKRAQDGGADARTVGSLDVQKLTVTLLFSKDVSKAQALLDSAAKSGALGEQGRARFAAMIDWRKGKVEEAIKALAPIRTEDPLARYAYASALADAKRQADAANEFKALAQAHVGTSIGLLALDRLAEVLAQQTLLSTQLSPEIAARAKALEDALVAHLPRSVDDLVENPLRALTVEIAASSTTVRPYEPLDFKVRMRNNSRIPLAIGRDAPISGKVTLRASAPRAGTADPAELPPQPILIDRRLRLLPGEEISVDVEAALTVIGLLLSIEPLDAHLVNVAVVSNPAAATGDQAPGLLGSVTGAPPIQFTGVVVTPEWVAESRALAKTAGSIDAVIRTALLAHAAADPARLPESVRGESKAIWDELAADWKALPERAQAWVLGVLPPETPAMAPLIEAARATTSPSVLRSWVLNRITDPKDPILDVCRRSGDADLAQLADAVTWTVERRAARAMQEAGLEAEQVKSVAPVPAGGKP